MSAVVVEYRGGPRNGFSVELDAPQAREELPEGTYVLDEAGLVYGWHLDAVGPDVVEHIRPKRGARA